jgi:hypothetical protein
MKIFLRSLAISALVALAFTGAAVRSASAQNPQVQRHPIIINEDHHDTSAPLREMIENMPIQYVETHVARDPETGRPPIIGHGPDTAVQKEVLPPVSAKLGLNFAGVGQGDYGFSDSVAPPDTNMSVGDTQVVQWVNESFGVFDKTTGALVSGPTAGNAFWAGFGGSCQTQNDGDIEIRYDQLAQRWVAGQLVFESTPYMYCIAVSTTDNALGTYNRYAISFGNNLDDYPKVGVWPDGYYLGVNIFTNGEFYSGPEMCAMNRTAMLAGQAMTAQCFQKTTENSLLLPSDVDGQTLPPAGEPNFDIALYNSTTLHEYQFHVDFTNPNNTTFTGPISITVPSYTEPCANFNLGECLTQPSPGELLEALTDRLLYRLAYRNFGTYEALVVDHTVTPTGGRAQSAVRWYEIHSPDTTPTVYQSGTYQNTTRSLWMGSVAMDQFGDMALGFSNVSPTQDASIAFAGRVPSDPLGKLEAAKIIKVGTGVQENTDGRWGDYSSMSLDPTDDCTFWYTTEYIKSNGSFNWSTQIANLRFKSCAAAQ